MEKSLVGPSRSMTNWTSSSALWMYTSSSGVLCSSITISYLFAKKKIKKTTPKQRLRAVETEKKSGVLREQFP